MPSCSPLTKRIDALALDQILGAQGFLGVGVQRRGKGIYALAPQLHAGGCAVTPVAHEMLGARGKPSKQVIALDAAARSARALAFE